MNDLLVRNKEEIRKLGGFEFLQHAFKTINSIIESSTQKVDKKTPLEFIGEPGRLQAEVFLDVIYAKAST
jgi:hypothetical protein